MDRDQQRVDWIQRAIVDANWDALVCSLPTNVLMFTGYWPVVGTALAIATRDGRIGLIAPEDERDLAEKGWANLLRTFKPGSLDEITNAVRAIHEPLVKMAKELNLDRAVIGFEHGAFHEPSSYASMHFYGTALREVMTAAVPHANFVPADEELKRLRSFKTVHEIARLRTACQIAQAAYTHGAKNLRAGLSETEVAFRFRGPLSIQGTGFQGVERADGFTFCMSGPNSALAYAAYQRSRARILIQGDLALVHCNSYADGFWTDITRTFCLGKPDERQQQVFDAIFAAREVALKSIAPGVKNAAVDQAAREVLRQRGFEKEFKHGVGHGVGYSAINHDAHPRIHPASQGRLEVGMVFNVEPGIYIEGWGGMRHCDMVAVTDDGAELLTPFLSRPEELILA